MGILQLALWRPKPSSIQPQPGWIFTDGCVMPISAACGRATALKEALKNYLGCQDMVKNPLKRLIYYLLSAL